MVPPLPTEVELTRYIACLVSTTWLVVFIIKDNVYLLQSKGGILAKTVDYINELKSHNARMVEAIKDAERLTLDTELLRQQVDDLRQENALLRAQLQQHGVELGTAGPTV